MKLVWSASQIKGARSYQEDFFGIVEGSIFHFVNDEHQVGDKALPSGSYLFIMADGMGGMGHGDEAASLVTTNFAKYFLSKFNPNGNFVDQLRSSLSYANKQLADHVEKNKAKQGMGCTVIASFVDVKKGTIDYISVGDSPIWRVRGRNISRINQIHSWGHQAERIWETQRQNDPNITLEYIRGLNNPDHLVSAVSGTDITLVDQQSDRLEEGDVYIIASDGLEVLQESELVDSIAFEEFDSNKAEQKLDYAVDQLMKRVDMRNNPKQDNTTAIAIAAFPAKQGAMRFVSNTIASISALKAHGDEESGKKRLPVIEIGAIILMLAVIGFIALDLGLFGGSDDEEQQSSQQEISDTQYSTATGDDDASASTAAMQGTQSEPSIGTSDDDSNTEEADPTQETIAASKRALDEAIQSDSVRALNLYINQFKDESLAEIQNHVANAKEVMSRLHNQRELVRAFLEFTKEIGLDNADLREPKDATEKLSEGELNLWNQQLVKYNIGASLGFNDQTLRALKAAWQEEQERIKEEELQRQRLASEQDAWSRAQQEDSIEAYEKYLNEYSNGEHAGEAELLVKALTDDENAWKKAQNENKLWAYNEYIDNYSQGKYLTQAQQKRQEILDWKVSDALTKLTDIENSTNVENQINSLDSFEKEYSEDQEIWEQLKDRFDPLLRRLLKERGLLKRWNNGISDSTSPNELRDFLEEVKGTPLEDSVAKKLAEIALVELTFKLSFSRPRDNNISLFARISGISEKPLTLVFINAQGKRTYSVDLKVAAVPNITFKYKLDLTSVSSAFVQVPDNVESGWRDFLNQFYLIGEENLLDVSFSENQGTEDDPITLSIKRNNG